MLDVLQRVPRLVGGRYIIEHQQHAGDSQQYEQEERYAPQSERVRHLDGVGPSAYRVEVQEYAVHDRQRAPAHGRRPAVAYDRAYDFLPGPLADGGAVLD